MKTSTGHDVHPVLTAAPRNSFSPQSLLHYWHLSVTQLSVVLPFQRWCDALQHLRWTNILSSCGLCDLLHFLLFLCCIACFVPGLLLLFTQSIIPGALFVIAFACIYEDSRNARQTSKHDDKVNFLFSRSFCRTVSSLTTSTRVLKYTTLSSFSLTSNKVNTNL